MGLLDDLSDAASDLIGAASDRASAEISGNQTTLPATVTAAPSATTTVLSKVNSSTITMVLGAALIGAMAFFAVKKARA